MLIPSQEECYRLIREMKMYAHIIVHSEQVCRVALLLAHDLNRNNANLNVDLIRASAMLHDITKTRSLQTHESHAQTGGDFLTKKGFPEVGRIVAQHVRLNAYFSSLDPIEAEVVNYADKRVLHDKIVPLADRMTYIFERYGNTEENRQRIRILWGKTEELENRLLAKGIRSEFSDMADLAHLTLWRSDAQVKR